MYKLWKAGDNNLIVYSDYLWDQRFKCTFDKKYTYMELKILSNVSPLASFSIKFKNVSTINEIFHIYSTMLENMDPLVHF